MDASTNRLLGRTLEYSVLGALLCAGCAHEPGKPNMEQEKDRSVVYFELIQPTNAFETIRTVAPTGVDAEREASLVRHCGGEISGADLASEMQAYATEVRVSPAGSYTGKNLLKEYAAVWGNKPLTTSFYKDVASGKEPSLKWRCFRLVRALCRQAQSHHAESQCSFTQDDVHMDLIGEFRLEQGDALKIRPLRLFYSRSMAEADHKMGVTIELQADSVWREVDRGRNEQIFVSPVLDEQLAVTEPNRVTGIKGSATASDTVKYYPLERSEWDSYPRLPLIPWSTRDGLGTPVQSGNAGSVTLSISVAEVGHAPEALSALDDVVTHYGDDIGKQLLKAANTAIDNSVN